MKTTISALRNRISILETDLSTLYRTASSSLTTSKIRELTGAETVVSAPDTKYEEVMASIEEYVTEIARLKAMVARLNASTKLSDSKSISEAIYTLNGLRRLRSSLYEASMASPSIVRRSDGGLNGGAYYDVRELNFDKATVKAKYDEATRKIAEMESEIDKLNNTEVEVEDL